ncbi:RNA methyltransferase [Candidatus Uhrbacteria bacterium CG10_big_fil_rev_8_21_14_0_10_48_16]|uniref:RNA methyltransferase n=1 Tax=Candidatus Uhrbacteria bacterium CG10_big_fil_rev_8_21_14_0_10_48_16 TaxID=1975038 RepID=A0A2M8LGB5_9BACT|nr:MAG: RNA methyltransferase [Candidatus Uhrbacteria bacterium CG10_big_fil_rev_8_21_14_0_10_48_16]
MIVIAHNIRSLHNVGSIFRSCDVFAIEKLYLTGFSGTPPRKEIAKVSLGSEHRVPWEYTEDVRNVLTELTKKGYVIVALENRKGSVSIDSFHTDRPIALILGNEVDGIEQEILDACDAYIEIDMPGKKQSLNVSVATGIALFALTRKAR